MLWHVIHFKANNNKNIITQIFGHICHLLKKFSKLFFFYLQSTWHNKLHNRVVFFVQLMTGNAGELGVFN